MGQARVALASAHWPWNSAAFSAGVLTTPLRRAGASILPGNFCTHVPHVSMGAHCVTLLRAFGYTAGCVSA
eukprot:9504001-Pyramimonas_sp.AAC.4